MQTSVNLARIKSFVKHLSTADRRFKERDQARLKLQKDLRSLQSLKSRKPHSLGSKLAKIEEGISDLLEKEIILIKGQSRESELSNALKRKVELLEAELIRTREEDLKLIMEFKNKVSDMGEELRSTKKVETEISTEMKTILKSLHQKVDSVHKNVTSGKNVDLLRKHLTDINDKIQDVKSSSMVSEPLLNEIHDFETNLLEIVEKGVLPVAQINEDIKSLKNRLDEVLKAKEDREKKIDQIEKRIKDGFGFNEHGIMQIEDKIKLMEEKLLKLQGKYSDQELEGLHSKISDLKQKSQSKRIGASPELPPPIKQGLSIPAFEVEIPQTEDVSQGLEFSSKNDMDLSSIDDLDIPPPPPNIPKKKGFFGKFFKK